MSPTEYQPKEVEWAKEIGMYYAVGMFVGLILGLAVGVAFGLTWHGVLFQ